jgi:hypothetical protein
LQKPAAPEICHARGYLHLFRDFLVLQTLRRHQNNAAALGYPLWGGSPPHQPLQLCPYRGFQLDRWRYPHTDHLYSLR